MLFTRELIFGLDETELQHDASIAAMVEWIEPSASRSDDDDHDILYDPEDDLLPPPKPVGIAPDLNDLTTQDDGRSGNTDRGAAELAPFVDLTGSADRTGGAGHDTIYGGPGDLDQLRVQDSNEEIHSSADESYIHGGSGVDTIHLGDGYGRASRDVGADTFRWAAGTAHSNTDAIIDFEVGVNCFAFCPGFFQLETANNLDDVLMALEVGDHTQLVGHTKNTGWKVVATLPDADAANIQVRILNGTLLEPGNVTGLNFGDDLVF